MALRRLVAAAAVILALSATAAAQSAPLRGVVQDHRGNPVVGAVITVEHPQEKTAVRVAVTNLSGEYAVDRLERITPYVVRVSHPEFQKARATSYAGDRLTVRLKPRRSCGKT